MDTGNVLAGEPKPGIRMQCTNNECGRKWIYRGRKKFYASCPDCHTSVRIQTAVKGARGRHEEIRE